MTCRVHGLNIIGELESKLHVAGWLATDDYTRCNIYYYRVTNQVTHIPNCAHKLAHEAEKPKLRIFQWSENHSCIETPSESTGQYFHATIRNNWATRKFYMLAKNRIGDDIGQDWRETKGSHFDSKVKAEALCLVSKNNFICKNSKYLGNTWIVEYERLKATEK